MKIAYDHQAFCLQSYGGVSRYHVKLAEHLALLGEEVGVFAPIHRNRYLAELSSPVVHGLGLKRYRIPGSRTMQKINARLARPLIDRWRPDLVHETYFHERGMTPQQCKSVITVYDMTHELFPDQVNADDTTSVLKRLAVDRADHVLCISESTRRDLIEVLGIAEEKTTVVHLGIEPMQANNNAADTSLVGDKPFMLFVGRRGGYKNFSGLLRAVAASDRLLGDFNIIAFGGSSFRSAEKAEIRELGFSTAQVQQVSGSDAVLANLYGSASALVYPSMYEGFGLPPLEAMALDCPVVSSRISSMPEVIGDAAEYFESGSIEDLRNAIESVLYSTTRGNRLRALGQARVKQFTWEACAKGTREVYEQVLAG